MVVGGRAARRVFQDTGRYRVVKIAVIGKPSFSSHPLEMISIEFTSTRIHLILFSHGVFLQYPYLHGSIVAATDALFPPSCLPREDTVPGGERGRDKKKRERETKRRPDAKSTG